MNIYLIYGGKSAEHEISLLTAKNIINHIDTTKHRVHPIYVTKSGTWLSGPEITAQLSDSEQLRLHTANTDAENGVAFRGHVTAPSVLAQQEGTVVFPVLHGPNGEDGTLQGMLELMDLPYVGTNVVASACGMDKIISKKLFEMAGLPQVPYLAVLYAQWQRDPQQVLQNCEVALRYPMFVKPANMGSSVGISRAQDAASLQQALEEAFRYDRRVVVEEGVEARELEVAVLGNDDPQASAVGEIVKEVAFYDFEEKYVNNTVKLQIPAQISQELSDTLRAYALDAFEAIDGCGLTRCDFFLTEQNDIYINEVNTMPGFTPFSMYPLLWEHEGVSYNELIERLLTLAVERYQQKKRYQTSDQ